MALPTIVTVSQSRALVFSPIRGIMQTTTAGLGRPTSHPATARLISQLTGLLGDPCRGRAGGREAFFLRDFACVPPGEATVLF